MILNFLFAILPPTRFFPVKRILLRSLGVSVGQGSEVCGGVKFYGAGRVRIGKDCWIGIGCRFYTRSGMDIVIGDNCDIAPEVAFTCGSHEFGDRRRRAGKGRSKSISVGSGSWVGMRCLLLGGCRLGESCIVGANSLLLEGEYPDSTLMFGSPGKIIRHLDP